MARACTAACRRVTLVPAAAALHVAFARAGSAMNSLACRVEQYTQVSQRMAAFSRWKQSHTDRKQIVLHDAVTSRASTGYHDGRRPYHGSGGYSGSRGRNHNTLW